MDFTSVSQNGIEPVSDLKVIESLFALAVNTTSTVAGAPLILRAISDAAMYKTVPVTFSAIDSSTNTITLGTSTWNLPNTSDLVLLDGLSTGTYSLYCTWPGEGKFAGQTTESNPVPITILAGQDITGPFVLSAEPDPGVIDETVVLNLSHPSGTAINGTTATVYIDNTFFAKITITNGLGSTSTVFNSTGTHAVTAYWPGGRISGTTYKAKKSNTVNLQINLFGTFPGTLNTVLTQPVNTIRNNNILTITANTSSPWLGTVNFYDSTTTNFLGTGTISNNSANIVLPAGRLGIGSHDIFGKWAGTTIAPKYGPKDATTSTLIIQPPANIQFSVSSNTVYQYYNPNGTVNATPPTITFGLIPNRSLPSYADVYPAGIKGTFYANNPFKAYNTQTSVTETNSTTHAASVTVPVPIIADEIHSTVTCYMSYPDVPWLYAGNSLNSTIYVSKSIISPFSVYSTKITSTRFESITLSATKPNGYTLTEPAQLKLNGTTIASVPFVGNTATYATAGLPSGTYSLSAYYPEDATHESTSSNTITQTIQKVKTPVTFTAVPQVPYMLTAPDGLPYNIIVPGDKINIGVSTTASTTTTNCARSFTLVDNGTDVGTNIMSFASYATTSTSSVYTVGTIAEGYSAFSATSAANADFDSIQTNSVQLWSTVQKPVTITFNYEQSGAATDSQGYIYVQTLGDGANVPISDITDSFGNVYGHAIGQGIFAPSLKNNSLFMGSFFPSVSWAGDNSWGKQDGKITITNGSTGAISTTTSLTNDQSYIWTQYTTTNAPLTLPYGKTTLTFTTPADKINQQGTLQRKFNCVYSYSTDYFYSSREGYFNTQRTIIPLPTSTTDIQYYRRLFNTAYTGVYGGGPDGAWQVIGLQYTSGNGLFFNSSNYRPINNKGFPSQAWDTNISQLSVRSPGVGTTYTNTGTLSLQMDNVTYYQNSSKKISIVVVRITLISGTYYMQAVDSMQTGATTVTPVEVTQGTPISITWNDAVPIANNVSYGVVFVNPSANEVQLNYTNVTFTKTSSY